MIEVSLDNNYRVSNYLVSFIFVILFLVVEFFVYGVYLNLRNKSRNAVTLENSYKDYLEIGNEESSIIAKKVKFYDFAKIGDNTISYKYTYLSDDTDNFDVLLEIYDSDEKIIYVNRMTYENSGGIINLTDRAYEKATYIKIKNII